MKRFLSGRRRGLCLADLLVVVALIPLVAFAFLACRTRVDREGNSRVRCASNLRQIGQAILLYANENRGEYPRTRYVGGEVVHPVWGTGAATTQPFAENGPQANDVSAALFLLLRTEEFTSELFVCPHSNAERWDYGGGGNTAMNWSNWNGSADVRIHLSYSYANPYPDNAAAKSGYKLSAAISADFAVAADMNPGVVNGSTVLSASTLSPIATMKLANSRNHDGDGQNVLYGDGHVEFQQNPFCGINRDNIYARRKAASGDDSTAVVDSPLDLNDSVLLPCGE